MKKLRKSFSIAIALGLIVALNIDIRSDSNQVFELSIDESVEAQKIYGYEMETVTVLGGCTYERCEPTGNPEDWCEVTAQTTCWET